MTEAAWTRLDLLPRPRFEFVRRSVSRRKLRLYGCACCRLVWEHLPDDRSRAAVEVCERYADGQATQRELAAAHAGAVAAFEGADQQSRPVPAPWSPRFPVGPSAEREEAAERYWLAQRLRLAAHAVRKATRPTDRLTTLGDEVAQAADAACEATRIGLTWPGWQDCLARHARIVHCLFGNPFRPVAFDPGWHTTPVVALAGQIHENQNFALLPILADALQDAGCGNEDILGHCCSDGPHARGCWVVDLILGKS